MRAAIALYAGAAAVLAASPTASLTASITATRSPTRTSTPSPSTTASVASPTPTPSQTPSPSGFPVLVAEDTWAVVDTSNTSTTGDALIPTTGLLFRDQNNGELYLRLQSVTPCSNPTGDAPFGGCPLDATGVAGIINDWASGGAYDASFGYFPNVASEGTTHVDGSGGLTNKVRGRAECAHRSMHAAPLPPRARPHTSLGP